MADALGWGVDGRPAWTVTGGGTESGGGVEVFGNADARRQLAEAVALRNGNQANACERRACEPAGTLFFGKRTNAVDWVVRTGNNSMVTGRTGSRRGEGDVQAYERSVHVPAPTLDTNVGGKWTIGRPATTVCGDARIAPPGHRDREGGERQFGEQTVRVTVQEAAVLQSFPADYPWQGNKSQQYRCVGDAVPPLLAKAILEPLVARSTEWRRSA
jgi:DNA (cytosine-5)-methyltransferase 1